MDVAALLALCAVQLLLVVDVSIVNIGLGALRRDLAVSGGAAACTLGPLLPAGVGIGLVFVPLILAATAGVEPRDTGVAGGLLNTSQVLGEALGSLPRPS
jgi:hypothetical protein